VQQCVCVLGLWTRVRACVCGVEAQLLHADHQQPVPTFIGWCPQLTLPTCRQAAPSASNCPYAWDRCLVSWLKPCCPLTWCFTLLPPHLVLHLVASPGASPGCLTWCFTLLPPHLVLQERPRAAGRPGGYPLAHHCGGAAEARHRHV